MRAAKTLGPSLDDKDVKVIQILERNSRTPISEIARELKVSDVAIIKRLRKLEQEGVIKRYTVLLDPRKLGYSYVAITGIDVESDKIFEVANEVSAKEYVKFAAITTGDHAIITVIWARDSSELAKILSDIGRINGVKRVCPAILLETVKE